MKKFTADFETTTDPNDCRVWAWAICEICNVDNFEYGTTIDSFFEWCKNKKNNSKVLFHNLKFDGSFILHWLLNNGYEWVEDKKSRRDKTFTTLITDMGAWYSIDVWFETTKGHVNKITFQDSLKILNQSVDDIAKGFGLPISKLNIDYRAYRSPDHVLTDEEVAYIRNDVEIMARALAIMYEQGLTKMTIASDALNDYKEMMGTRFKKMFPVLPADVDNAIRKSYKGGFTYLSPKWKNKIAQGIVVFDVNSLYPYEMSSANNQLPVGIPEPFDGKYEEDKFYPLYVQKITCSFKVKPDKIPSIQLKNCLSFMPNEYIESTDGEIVGMCLTKPDFELFQKQYDIDNLEYHGGYKFKSMQGMFNDYVGKWTNSKIQAKKDGNKSLYAISKLMLNSLYGKFGLSPKGAKKRPVLDHNNVVRYTMLEEEERESIYVAMASFITSYARRYTIETSQMIREWSKKYKGYDAYIYSDTDSIHCNITEEDAEELKQYIRIDDYELGAWKKESVAVKGLFIRQKCYIEQWEDGSMNVTVAGLPKKLGHLINFDNFKEGFTTEGLSDEEIGEKGRKLRYRYVNGGVILEDTDFTIK